MKRSFLLILIMCLTVSGIVDERNYEKEKAKRKEKIQKEEQLKKIESSKPEKLPDLVEMPDVDPMTKPVRPCDLSPSKIDCMLEWAEM
jgi:hypothetical protein